MRVDPPQVIQSIRQRKSIVVKQRQYDRVNKAVGVKDESCAAEAPAIWEKVVALGESIPQSAWKNVPTDLARNWQSYKFGRGKARDG